MNTRIKELRKFLGLTMEIFGRRIGVTKSTISNIENGNRNATEHMIKSICREYNADYIWLTTGKGEMFVDRDDNFRARIDYIMTDENDMRKNMFKALLDASDEDIAALNRIINLYSNLIKENCY